MKEIIIVTFLIAISLVGLIYFSYEGGYSRGYQRATENLIEGLDLTEEKLATCSADLESQDEFIEDRCVCVYYDSGGLGYLTQEEICEEDWNYYEVSKQKKGDK